MEKLKDANKITVHNKILNNYRSVHIDGAYGGVTSRGLINVSFFAERQPIPKSSDFAIKSSGHLGDLISNDSFSKQGIIREFEFGVYMDANVAQSLITFLQAKLTDLENIVKASNEKDVK